MLILPAEADDGAVNGAVDRISRVIGETDGTVTNVDTWGRRRLAHQIDKRTEGSYVVVDMSADPTVIVELERVLHLADDVVRFKVMAKPPPRKPRVSAKAKAAAASNGSAAKSAPEAEAAPEAETAPEAKTAPEAEGAPEPEAEAATEPEAELSPESSVPEEAAAAEADGEEEAVPPAGEPASEAGQDQTES
jgi:small subunit ribosomal protein S6